MYMKKVSSQKNKAGFTLIELLVVMAVIGVLASTVVITIDPQRLMAQTRVHTGLLWAVALATLLWALLKYTVLGFDIRAVGANARAAAFAGVSVTRTVVWVALLSGGLAGLAGAI